MNLEHMLGWSHNNIIISVNWQMNKHKSSLETSLENMAPAPVSEPAIKYVAPSITKVEQSWYHEPVI